MTKVKELEGHTTHVLYTTVSPDGLQVVPCTADETLWLLDAEDKMSFLGTNVDNVNDKTEF